MARIPSPPWGEGGLIAGYKLNYSSDQSMSPSVSQSVTWPVGVSFSRSDSQSLGPWVV